MTSVPSRLLPLNGNNLLRILLLALLVYGCGTASKTGKSEKIVPIKGIPAPHDTLAILHPDSLLKDTMVTYLKDTYHIAVVLPFYLNFPQIDTLETKSHIYPASEMALDFYQGILLANDSLEQLGLSAKIHVFDSRNDEKVVSRLVRKPVMKKMDLIIGPIYNNSLRVMAEFAREENISMVSPLSPASNITTDNPYYIMVNPTIEVHCEKLFEYVMQEHYDDNVMIISQPSSVDWEYAQLFKKYLENYQNLALDYSFYFTEIIYNTEDGDETITEDDNDDFLLHFDPMQNNVVIIPSIDKAYLYNVSRKLFSLFEEDEYTITVLGLPIWGDYTSMRFDYIDKLNVHFTSSYWLPDNFYTGDLYKSYVNEYHHEPSEYAIKGYDLMLYFGRMLQKHGTRFHEMLDLEKENMLHTSFHFEPRWMQENHLMVDQDTLFKGIPDSLLPEPRVEIIENKYVHLLKYENFSIKKVN